jgi:hypothetical protein
MHSFPAVHRLVTVLALCGGCSLVGVAAGGVRTVDAQLAAAQVCPVHPPAVLDRDVEL